MAAIEVVGGRGRIKCWGVKEGERRESRRGGKRWLQRWAEVVDA